MHAMHAGCHARHACRMPWVCGVGCIWGIQSGCCIVFPALTKALLCCSSTYLSGSYGGLPWDVLVVDCRGRLFLPIGCYVLLPPHGTSRDRFMPACTGSLGGWARQCMLWLPDLISHSPGRLWRGKRVERELNVACCITRCMQQCAYCITTSTQLRASKLNGQCCLQQACMHGYLRLGMQVPTCTFVNMHVVYVLCCAALSQQMVCHCQSHPASLLGLL